MRKVMCLVTLVLLFAACFPARPAPEALQEDLTGLVIDYLSPRGYRFIPASSRTNFLDILDRDAFEELFGWSPDFEFYPIPTSLVLPDGVLGMIQADFDGDGAEEVLVICTVWNPTALEDSWAAEWDSGSNELYLMMVAVRDGAAREIARASLHTSLNPGHTSFEGLLDFFAITLDDRVVIGIQEYTYTGGAWANGMSMYVRAFEFVDGAFSNVLYVEHWDFATDDEAHIANMVQIIRNAGFSTISHPSERAIDMEPNITHIASLEHGPDVPMGEFFAMMQDLSAENLDLPPIYLHITNTVHWYLRRRGKQ